MRLTHAVFGFVVAAVACSRSDSPTGLTLGTPPPIVSTSQPVSSDGVIAGFVIDEADQCIIGARVELIGGPRAGSSYVQTLCGFWDYGDDIGYSFRLPIGVPQIVHASAAGYRPAERTFAATMPYQYTNYITLKKDP